MQQIVYHQQTPNQIHTDGQIQYIVQQDDDSANESYTVAQQAPQQIFYTKVATENGSQLIPHGMLTFNCRIITALLA